ncbi:MAG: hypothetical protein H0U45_00510 [Tatlockia sp.]|nr:hypothetical protein [Tatlockia sp.]
MVTESDFWSIGEVWLLKGTQLGMTVLGLQEVINKLAAIATSHLSLIMLICTVRS